jgi:hypothetical protein
LWKLKEEERLRYWETNEVVTCFSSERILPESPLDELLRAIQTYTEEEWTRKEKAKTKEQEEAKAAAEAESEAASEWVEGMNVEQESEREWEIMGVWKGHESNASQGTQETEREVLERELHRELPEETEAAVTN